MRARSLAGPGRGARGVSAQSVSQQWPGPGSGSLAVLQLADGRMARLARERSRARSLRHWTCPVSRSQRRPLTSLLTGAARPHNSAAAHDTRTGLNIYGRLTANSRAHRHTGAIISLSLPLPHSHCPLTHSHCTVQSARACTVVQFSRRAFSHHREYVTSQRPCSQLAAGGRTARRHSPWLALLPAVRRTHTPPPGRSRPEISER